MGGFRGIALLAVLITVLASPRTGLANGGPVAWTGTTADGSIAPIRNQQIQLLREELGIRIEDDGQHYQVEARYTLSNPGPDRVVMFGVPFYWPSPDGPDGVEEEPVDAGPQRPPPEAAAMCKAVETEIGGKTFGLGLPASESGDDGTSWCVADLPIPTGDETALSLRYRAELQYVDEAYSKSVLTVFKPRTLRYQLFPAGYWRGPAQTVSITVDGGNFGNLMKIERPKAGRVVNGVARWELKNVDLSKEQDIVVMIDSRTFLQHREILEVSRKQGAKLSATTSSVLDPNRYPAAQLVDGDPRTAWCASKSEAPGKAWFEVRLAAPGQQGESCGFETFYILPGYAKNQSTWRSNARIRRIRLTGCDQKGEPWDLEVPRSRRFDASAFALSPGEFTDDGPWLDYGEPFLPREHESEARGPACVRVTILDAEPGTDLCVSEFGFLANCQ